MPLRSEWAIQREGFNFDYVLKILDRTALNPWHTLPSLLYMLYTARGKAFAEKHPGLAKWLRRFVVFGLLRKFSRFMDEGVTNNWSNDQYNWRREIVVVTGGSDGIGALAVQLLAEKGIRVVVLDIQPLQYESPPNVHYFPCDLANPDAIKTVTANINKHIGAPTILINNAGFVRGKSILDCTDEDLRLTFQINTISHYQLAQAFLPAMIKNNHGMIVTVASLASYVTVPRLVDYCASKAAALTFHEGLQTELACVYRARNVRTVAICQGYTKTALFEGFHRGDRFMTYPLAPETVAEEIVRAVLRGQSAHVILPRANSLVSGIRGWPFFMQASVRKDMRKMMKKWKGRQVAQPSERVSGSGLGESEVLV